MLVDCFRTLFKTQQNNPFLGENLLKEYRYKTPNVAKKKKKDFA